MKSDNEIRKELDEIVIERNRIQKELYEIEEKLKVFEDSMYFNVFDITKIFAELVSKKENASYCPVFYDNRNIGRGTFVAELDIGIIRSKYENEALWKFYHFLENDDVSLGAEEPIFIGAIYYTYLTKTGQQDPYKVNITFTSLLKKFNTNNVLSKGGVCNCTFMDYPYINDFIKYLYILQVQNNGKHLTYEEMQVALNDFLSKEKDKPKQKTKK